MVLNKMYDLLYLVVGMRLNGMPTNKEKLVQYIQNMYKKEKIAHLMIVEKEPGTLRLSFHKTDGLVKEDIVSYCRDSDMGYIRKELTNGKGKTVDDFFKDKKIVEEFSKIGEAIKNDPDLKEFKEIWDQFNTSKDFSESSKKKKK